MDEYREPQKEGPSRSEQNAMFIAAEKGHADVVEMLLDNGYSLDVFNDRGETPLHVATRFNQQSVIRVLLKRGANPFSTDLHGYTPWHTASVNTDTTLIRLFLDWGKKKDDDTSPRAKASRKKRVRKLKDRTAEKEECSKITPKMTPQDGYPCCVHNTVEGGDGGAAAAVDLPCSRLHASFDAAELLKQTTPRFAMQEIDEGFSHSFFSRITNESINQMSRGKLDTGDGKDNGVTALHLAARFANEDVVRRFLKKKVDLNSPSYCGRSVLLMAAAGGCVRIIKMLVKEGADIHAKDLYGFSALHVAAYFGQASAARYFLSSGLCTSLKCKNGNTPLHYAAIKQKHDTAEVLVKAGAYIHAENDSGLTPAMIASQMKDEEMYQIIHSLIED